MSYLIKARERLGEVEREESKERRRRELGIDLRIIRGAVDTEGIPDDGPPGAKMKAKYLGSFEVHPPPGLTGRALQSSIGGFISEMIGTINPKRVDNSLSLTMFINRYGVRMLSKDKKLFMACPIRKILNCQMFPRPPLFAMMCKLIHGRETLHYCHVFNLSSPEQASELNQYMSQAFKIAFAHNDIRNTLERPKKGKGKKAASKDSKQKTKNQPSTQAQQPSSPPPQLLSSPSPPHLPRQTTPFANRRSGSISGGSVTIEGLQEEVSQLQIKVNQTEDRLNSISPESEEVFALTLELSSYEDQLQVKQVQLQTLLELPPEQQPHAGGAVGGVGGGAMGGASAPIDEAQILQDAQWYQMGLPREMAMQILMQEPPGSFVVRDSASNPGCYALSLRTDKEILNYLIIVDHLGYYFQGTVTHHPSLTALILHHASVVDHLPCALSLGATNLLSDLPPAYDTLTDDIDGDMDDEEMYRQLAKLSVYN